MMIKENSNNRTQFHCYTKDYSIGMFFLFQVLINVLVLTYDGKRQLISVIICSINGFLAFQQLILPKGKAILYQQICIILSKVATLILIIIVGSDLQILIIGLFERLDFMQTRNRTLKYFDHLLLRLITLIIMMFDFNLFLTLTLAYTILIEINKIILEKSNEEKQFQYNVTYENTMKGSDQLWNYRLNLIPQCFMMINLSNLKVTYKNTFLYTYFKQCYENDDQLNEILLHKLKFTLIQDKIDEIKQLHQKPQINQRLTKNYNLWQYKRDSISLQQPPQQKLEQSKGGESLEFPSTTQGSIYDILTNLKLNSETDEKKSGRYIEIYTDQSWQSINLHYNYSFSSKKLQLSGQIIFSEQEEEVLLTFIDISKQNELYELTSNSEFKSKIIESFSHELRTPLNSALNFLGSCLYDKRIQQMIREEYVQPAINSLKLQSFIISDIIDLSQISTNNFILSIREFSIREILKEIFMLFKIQFEMKRIDLKINLLECSTNRFTSDYQRLIQILVNLLQNSLKFSLGGTVLLQISTTQNQGLKICVSDQGIGIDSNHLSQLQSLLQNIEQYKDIQLNKIWQGFGLLISAILVNQLAPKDNKLLQINSSGKDQGSQVWFYVENQHKTERHRQNTLRQSSSKFQSSHDDQLFNMEINYSLFKVTDFRNQTFSKQFNQSFKRNETIKNDFNCTDSQSFESLQFKLGQLSPLSPSLITEKLFKFAKQGDQENYQYNLKMIIEPDIKEDQEFLQIVRNQQKCTCQNLLSVDDEIFNQKSIQILLAKLGFDVILAFNGAEAIKIVEQAKPCGPKCQLFTIILMDYQMPILDGCATTVKLVEMMNKKLIPKIHIIGLTAFTSASDISNCIKAGMSDVLSKPLNLKELKEILTLV